MMVWWQDGSVSIDNAKRRWQIEIRTEPIEKVRERESQCAALRRT